MNKSFLTVPFGRTHSRSSFMRRSRPVVLILSVLFLLMMDLQLFADWSPGDAYKMHSPQLPNAKGNDICLVHQAVADDFKCSETGYIRDIHFWVSWKGDVTAFSRVGWNVSICASAGPNTMDA
jgi:hypothetical protein